MPENQIVTEAEFFNQGLYCGEHGIPSVSVFNLHADVYGPQNRNGCRARNWKVLRNGLLRQNERILKCRECGAVYPVEVRNLDGTPKQMRAEV